MLLHAPNNASENWALGVGPKTLRRTPSRPLRLQLSMCGGAYFILFRVLVAAHGANSVVAKTIRCVRNGIISLVIYATAIGVAFWMPIIAMALYVCVALI